MKRFAEIVLESAIDHAIITINAQGLITYWSPGAENIFGWTSQEVLGQPIDIIFTSEDRSGDLTSTEIDTALTHGRSLDERWHARKDGKRFWASGEMLPLVAGGPTEGFVKILRDRTLQKRAEDLQHLLIEELSHRIKNMTAVVQSIVNQSFRGAEDMNNAKLAISQRLAVLSNAQDILLRDSGKATSLEHLIRRALAVAEEGERSSRIRIEGDELHVGPRAAMSLALMLHELLTNALKYGALSDERGIVDIRWRTIVMSELPCLELIWKESGGPQVVQPTRKGFGSRLLQGGITGSTSKVELDFAPQGLQCRIVSDLAAVLED